MPGQRRSPETWAAIGVGPNDLALKVFIELIEVQEDPRLLVLVTHGYLEVLVNALVECKCKTGKKIASSARDYPHSAKLLVLNEIGVIDDDTYRRLDRFRKLRNKAAHEPLFHMDVHDLQHLRGASALSSEIIEVCVDLISAVWNPHAGVLSPIFNGGPQPRNVVA